MTRERALAEIAASQHGHFTHDQAIAVGFSQTSIGRRTASGMYERVYPDVYRVSSSPPGHLADVMAACLSIHELAAASHATAALLWEMTTWSNGAIHVVTRRWERRRRTDFTVHESMDLRPWDVVGVDGIPTTTPERTIVDLAAIAPTGVVAASIDTALRTEVTEVDRVARFVRRVARPGRRGIRRTRQLIAERHQWAERTESALEDRFRRLLLRAGRPDPVPQYRVRDETGHIVLRADFAYPEQRLLIELDSEQFHLSPEAFQADRRKQNLALRLGWRTMRVTWDQITREPEVLLHTLASLSTE